MPPARPSLPMLLRLSEWPLPDNVPTAPLAFAVYSFRSIAVRMR
jgi:hypothetical protein